MEDQGLRGSAFHEPRSHHLSSLAAAVALVGMAYTGDIVLLALPSAGSV